MTSMTRRNEVKIPISIAYKIIIDWVHEHNLDLRKAILNENIIAKFKFRVGPIKTKKVFFALRQIDQFSIQIATKINMSGGLAFKGMLNQVFRKSSLYNLSAYLDIFEKKLEELSNVKTLEEKRFFFFNNTQAVLDSANIASQPSFPQWESANTTPQPPRFEWESANMTPQPSPPQWESANTTPQPSQPQPYKHPTTYQPSINPQEKENNRLLEKKATFLNFIREAEETDLSFANNEKKDNVQRTIALYNHKIKEIDKQLEALSK